jgi:hypothetical protein
LHAPGSEARSYVECSSLNPELRLLADLPEVSRLFPSSETLPEHGLRSFPRWFVRKAPIITQRRRPLLCPRAEHCSADAHHPRGATQLAEPCVKDLLLQLSYSVGMREAGSVSCFALLICTSQPISLHDAFVLLTQAARSGSVGHSARPSAVHRSIASPAGWAATIAALASSL